MTTTYYVQTSTDNGKSFDPVFKTTIRGLAFIRYMTLVEADGRVLLFTENRLTVASHLADAQREVGAISAKAGA